MPRIDYFNDANAPKANSLVPAVSAIITDRTEKILLHRRSDNDLWGLPGGTMEPGETVSEAIKREAKEETGLVVQPVEVIGIYSNPQHVIAYNDGEIRQEFSICFRCEIESGELQLSRESNGLAFFTPEEIEHLEMHPSIRKRIEDARNNRKQIVFT